MRIAVIGTGYVGLVTGACLSDAGNDVICVDIDKRKIKMLRAGTVPIYEPGLKELIERNTAGKRLLFTTDLKKAVENSKLIFIAVGTPQNHDGSAKLTYIFNVAKDIAKVMNEYKIIISKSTVPIGTGDIIKKKIRKWTKYDFDIVSNPEFLKEGAAVEDFMRPDRVIIGTDNPDVADTMRELYSPYVRTGKPIIVMDVRSAEMAKYASNVMLATKISFINEIANLCERVGANIDSVRKGLTSDSRIGTQFLFPGVGFGGSCFPKDVKSLVHIGKQKRYNMRLIKAVDEVNGNQKRLFVDKILNHFKGNISKKIMSVWGISFKPRTNDMREAPSIFIIKSLLKKGTKIKVHDPEAMKEARKIFSNKVKYCKIPYDTIKDSDALIVTTEWNEFRKPDFIRMKKLMKSPVIFDGRNIYDPILMEERGFIYYGIGR